jgi:hypothetical protein
MISSTIRRGLIPLHPIGLVIEIFKYKIFKKSFVSKYLITTFLLFGGGPATKLSKVLGKKTFDALDNFKSDTLVLPVSENHQKELKDSGCLLIPNAVSKSKIGELFSVSETTLGIYRRMDSGTKFESDTYFTRDNPQAIRFDYHPNELIKNSIIQEFICDPAILKIAQDYLGTMPILDFIAMWWHVKSDQPDKEAAQYFHFDMDRLRWIKFFFYLTDVSSDSGPHVFIPRSQKDRGLPFSLRKKGYTRLSDNEVEVYYPKTLWQEFTGPSGSMIVEDTRGLHKGKHVHRGDRLVFQLQYTSSLFGNSMIPKIQLEKQLLAPALSTSLDAYPQIFQQIQII